MKKVISTTLVMALLLLMSPVPGHRYDAGLRLATIPGKVQPVELRGNLTAVWEHVTDRLS